VTPAQKTLLLAIDEWWKRFGFGPSVDDLLLVTGEKSRGNISRKMKKLVELGLCVHKPRMARSIRPTGLKVRDIN